MARYIATYTYQTPAGNVGTFRWDGQAKSHADADAKAKACLHGNRRHKPMRALDGSIYVVDWEDNAATAHATRTDIPPHLDPAAANG